MPRTPNTIVQFYNVPWDSGYRNLRYFGSANSRNAWFNARSHITFPDDFDMVEHAQPVKEGVPYTVRGTWDAMHNYNYMRYKNDGYSNSDWVYCFITGWSYGSEHSVTVSFVRDIWINNVDNFVFPDMFIERETGAPINDLPEPVSVNRYVYEEHKPMSLTNNELLYIALASGLPDESSHATRTCYLSGVKYPFEMKASLNWEDIDNFLQQYQTNGTSDRIVTVFAVPATVFSKTSDMIVDGYDSTVVADRQSGSYTPRHAKCLRYPYSYLEVGDYFGNKQIYKWENGWGDEFGAHFTFNQLSVIGMSSFIMLQPDDSQNASKGEGTQTISHSVHGQIGYVADGMANWIAQNTTQIKAQQEQFLLSTGAKLLGGLTGAVGAGLVTGGAGAVTVGASTAMSIGMDIANFEISQNAMMDRADYTPNSVSPPDGAVLGLLSQGKGVFFYRTVNMSPSEMRALDDFFTRFGYTVNRYGQLNLTSGSYYFVKTKGACVRGACPQSDRDMMMSVLDRGVTFWQKDSIGEY